MTEGFGRDVATNMRESRNVAQRAIREHGVDAALTYGIVEELVELHNEQFKNLSQTARNVAIAHI